MEQLTKSIAKFRRTLPQHAPFPPGWVFYTEEEFDHRLTWAEDRRYVDADGRPTDGHKPDEYRRLVGYGVPDIFYVLLRMADSARTDGLGRQCKEGCGLHSSIYKMALKLGERLMKTRSSHDVYMMACNYAE